MAKFRIETTVLAKPEPVRQLQPISSTPGAARQSVDPAGTERRTGPYSAVRIAIAKHDVGDALDCRHHEGDDDGETTLTLTKAINRQEAILIWSCRFPVETGRTNSWLE